jgi:hypothetical protein
MAPKSRKVLMSKIGSSSQLGSLDFWNKELGKVTTPYPMEDCPSEMHPIHSPVQDSSPKGKGKGKGKGKPSKGKGRGSSPYGSSSSTTDEVHAKVKGPKNPLYNYRGKGFLHLLYHYELLPDFPIDMLAEQNTFGGCLAHVDWTNVNAAHQAPGQSLHGVLNTPDELLKWANAMPLRWLFRDVTDIRADIHSRMHPQTEHPTIGLNEVDDFVTALDVTQNTVRQAAKTNPFVLYNACLSALSAHLCALRNALGHALDTFEVHNLQPALPRPFVIAPKSEQTTALGQGERK